MDLTDLYQQIIVDHNRSPRNFRRIENPTREAEGFNPLCGDKLKLYLQLDGNVVSDAAFEGSGCAISVASASLMTEALIGKDVAEAEALFQTMRDLFQSGDAEVDLDALGKLGALAGVRAFPSRIKCANLCWHALHAALDERDAASTE